MNSTDFSYLRSVKKFDPSVIKGANRMTDKTAIEKALRALYGWIKAEVEHFGATCPDDFIIEMVENALAALEAEKQAEVCKTDCEFYEGCLERFTHKKAGKPAEDAGEWAELTKKEMWETIQEIRTLVNSDGTKSIISDIEDYAESYHAEQCKACKALPEES